MEHSVNKISVISLRDRNKTATRPVSLDKQRGRDDRGRLKTLYKIDLASGTFDVEFTRAFELSVASARKENKLTASRKNLADPAE